MRGLFCGHSIVSAAKPPSRGSSTNLGVTHCAYVFAVDIVLCVCLFCKGGRVVMGVYECRCYVSKI